MHLSRPKQKIWEILHPLVTHSITVSSCSLYHYFNAKAKLFGTFLVSFSSSLCSRTQRNSNTAHWIRFGFNPCWMHARVFFWNSTLMNPCSDGLDLSMSYYDGIETTNNNNQWGTSLTAQKQLVVLCKNTINIA